VPISDPKLARFSWWTVAYLVLVILWGAWVRISFSGDGCGDHWPTCGGELIPTNPSTKTLIEFAHRLTSGLALVPVLVMLVWAFRAFPKGHRARLGGVLTLVFLLSEAALGAGLVLFKLVAGDTSVTRAIVAGMHLVNTTALTGFAALTAFWAGGGGPLRGLARGGLRWGLLIAVVAFLLTGMTGAVTALGDTLFPVPVTEDGGLMARVRDGLSASEHFLVRLRLVHPILAVATALWVVGVAVALLGPERGHTAKRLAGLLIGVTAGQVLVGAVNVMLHAPTALQLVHLLFANALWVTLLMLGAHALSAPDPRRAESTAPARAGAAS
jgi:heme A synthase